MISRGSKANRNRRVGAGGIIGLAVMVAAAGCDSILEVDVPGQITESGAFIPSQAQVLVNSAIADIECAMSDFIASNAAGSEDVSSRSVGWWGSVYEYADSPGTANCSIAETSYGWFVPLQKGRWMAEQVYTRLTDEWDDAAVANRSQHLATSAIYAGISYTLLGEYFCEVTVNTGPLMSWEESLMEAEKWFSAALQHIASAGSFAIPTGITSDAEQMALLLRARAKFARGDLVGADADASRIQKGFISWITRESGGERTRWNRVYSAHIGQPGWVPTLGPIYWWDGPPNPATGQPWPDTIPFTGYWELAILEDGRAVSDAGRPVTLSDYPEAVADSRVPVVSRGTTGGPNQYPSWRPDKYQSPDDDMPLAKWEEAWLILAQIRGGQEAIDLVNEIRAAHGLPLVTYLAPGDAEGIQTMLIEEIRRTHFLEGRYWATKLRYNLWFPRGQGSDLFSHNYSSAVRLLMPSNEYILNPNLSEEDQGTLCPANQSPIL